MKTFRLFFLALLMSPAFLLAKSKLNSSTDSTITSFDGLNKHLAKKMRITHEIAFKNEAHFFTIRLIFKAGKLQTITPSKFTPKGVAKFVDSPDIYKSVNWKAVFNHEVVDDILIIPFLMRNDEDPQNAFFVEYTLEDIFEFNGEKQPGFNCKIMQPVIIRFSSPKA